MIAETPVYADGTVAYDEGIQWLYAPGGGLTPVARYQKGQLHYVVSDHMGTPRELLTEQGKVAWAGRLSTWGEVTEWPVAANDADKLSCNLRFAGQYADEESGLHYNRFRYYDNETGQYLSPDPIGLAGGVNPYGYVHNPLGLACVCPTEKIPVIRNSARQLLKNRGLNKQIQQDTINSFDGQIYASRGEMGDIFTITEHMPGSASQVYVTRGSAGATAAERRANLALPPRNSASYEGTVSLTRPQILLEGKVAPQLQWGEDKVGGGWQIVTDGGKYSGATQ